MGPRAQARAPFLDAVARRAWKRHVLRLPRGQAPHRRRRDLLRRRLGERPGAVDFIRSYEGDEPLCIYLPLLYPHPPYGVEEPFYSSADRSALPPRIPAPADWDAAGKPSILGGIHERQGISGWPEERFDELRAVYYGMCNRIDHQLGLVLDALRERGFYDDTALFFFSDHGDFTGDYGLVEKTQNTFEDVLTRVPLVVKLPPGQNAGGRTGPRATPAMPGLSRRAGGARRARPAGDDLRAHRD